MAAMRDAGIESADAQRLQGWFARVLDAKSIDDALAD